MFSVYIGACGNAIEFQLWGKNLLPKYRCASHSCPQCTKICSGCSVTRLFSANPPHEVWNPPKLPATPEIWAVFAKKLPHFLILCSNPPHPPTATPKFCPPHKCQKPPNLAGTRRIWSHWPSPSTRVFARRLESASSLLVTRCDRDREITEMTCSCTSFRLFLCYEFYLVKI